MRIHTKVGFAADSALEGAGFEPWVPLYGELGALGRVRRTRAAIVKPGTPDRSRRRARRAICGTPGDGQAALEIGFGDFEHLAASLFAFSARFEICRDDRIVGRAKAQIADDSGIP